MSDDDDFTNSERAPTGDPEDAAAEASNGSAAAAPTDAAESGVAESDSGAGADADEDLVSRVEEADPETLATEIAALRSRAADAEAAAAEAEERVEELEERLKRKQAEFQNYKKRQERRREQERRRATEDLVVRLVDVRDNLRRGLEQDGDIREGVESTLRLFDDVLEAENVTEIAPEAGEAVDPQRHEVLMRVESDHPEGTVEDLYQPGYEMAEKVIKPAQVTVSEGTDGSD
ncbi:nucleotide exchange factor GrpE [Halomarina ordinaria]|uniref:Protein GrpE n=1 Tax=Halomarina ordinaria TaxID=3033939 RepID=A0ABD5U8F0_9EURY|nr:nucleotide exchange factor GrpE [Halomarina sp. PSRA2]